MSSSPSLTAQEDFDSDGLARCRSQARQRTLPILKPITDIKAGDPIAGRGTGFVFGKGKDRKNLLRVMSISIRH